MFIVDSCTCVLQPGKDHQAGGEGWCILSLLGKRAQPFICWTEYWKDVNYHPSREEEMIP